MKRFYLERIVDVSGVSGLGIIAEGCEFDTKACALVWLQGKGAQSFYPDIETLVAIHGHEGNTKLVYVDNESTDFSVKREDRPGRRSHVSIGGVNLDGRRKPAVKPDR